MRTWHLHIQGQVQGVGFRPYVYQLAKEYALKGWVNNTVDGVHLEFNSTRGLARVFTRDLIERAPALSKITGHVLKESDPEVYDDFRIVHSDAGGKPSLLLTPDFAICEDCRNECLNPGNRRAAYPFITCTNCGPRYSIIRKLPYDRHTTTMDPFLMCKVCDCEYNSPVDRRYYSQTNSCPDCPVQLRLYNGKELVDENNQQELTNMVIRAWEAGRIVAIKGIGGYLLTCDAANVEAIRELRKRKNRPSKPFALMYPSIGSLEKDALVSEAESTELSSPASPILLLDLKDGHTVAMDEIAPGIKVIGAMLPYTPLYELLLQQFGRPIIATSGNISNSPIVCDDSRALEELTSIADHILANNRDIVVAQDDSVIRYSRQHQQRIILRRSRGIAPTYINADLEYPDATVFASGAMLKSTFTYLNHGNCYISQYLGDTDSYDTQEAHKRTRDHFFGLFNESPQIVLADKHPQYFSTEEAKKLVSQNELPIHLFQHHTAHFGAILGEHGLLHSEEAVLGVIWDGTGYGDDGQVWGGEFFTYDHYQFKRHRHFEYFPSMLGDKMAREPRISLLAAGYRSAKVRAAARKKFTAEEWSIYEKILKKDPELQTSSVGRLFDAAASLCGLIDKSTYEGEAAMYLENLAAEEYYFREGTVQEYYFEMTEMIETSGDIKPGILLEGMLIDLENALPAKEVALKFHRTLVEIIAWMAKQTGIKNIAFSGGVFQNSLLVDLINERMNREYTLYFHEQLSPNDENISFGQLMCYQIGEFRAKPD